jgi:hypothetical protein
VSDRIDPIVLPKHPKAVGHRFVERIRSHLDRMLTPPKIDTRDAAIAKAHGRWITHFAFSALARGGVVVDLRNCWKRPKWRCRGASRSRSH